MYSTGVNGARRASGVTLRVAIDDVCGRVREAPV